MTNPAENTDTVEYGASTIEYTLIYTPRKTLGISVHPDLSVTVNAPEGSDIELIRQKIRKRASWILRQQRDFRRYSPDFPPRRYVSGETHRYLGRQYRLKVIEDESDGIKLSRGYLYVQVRDKSNTGRVRDLVERWYRNHARRVFQERLEACYAKVERLGVPYPELSLRAMQTRWGSCTMSGHILLNPKLIQVPTQLIDYVILHELCHLKEHHHGPTFYTLLDRVLPGWRETKRRLDEYEFG